MLNKTVLNYFIACYLFFFVTLLGITGLGFMIAAIYLLLSPHLAAWAAALLTAVVVLVLALQILLAVWLVVRNKGEKRDRSEDARPESNDDIARLMLEMMRKSNFNARDASLLALLAGAILGASPELRRQLLALFSSGRGQDTQ
ncbi:MAG: phage holin family protein [Gammaproteobacteria bacterium]